MDAKVTLSFNAQVIGEAKKFAENHGISLSRLTEVLLKKAIAGNYKSIENMPIANWVSKVAEGNAEYVTKPRKRNQLKEEFYKNKSKK